MPDCIPLSSCLIDSSSVVTRSDWPDDCGLFPCDWLVSVRAGGNCSRGATRPGPVIQGQFKAVINIHRNMPRQCADLDHTLLQQFQTDRHTFTFNKQGQLSGVRLSAGSYEHDNLVMCVFRNVSAIDEHYQVSLQEFGLTSTCLQNNTGSLKS